MAIFASAVTTHLTLRYDETLAAGPAPAALTRASGEPPVGQASQPYPILHTEGTQDVTPEDPYDVLWAYTT